MKFYGLFDEKKNKQFLKNMKESQDFNWKKDLELLKKNYFIF